MPITLIKAYIKDSNEWVKRDVEDYVVDNLTALFPEGYLFLADDTESRTVSFKDMISHFSTLDRAYTVKALLRNKTLDDFPPHREVRNLSDAKYMSVYDTFNFGLRLKMGNINYGEGVSVPTSLQTDLQISTGAKDKGIMLSIAEGCLLSLNGQVFPIKNVGDLSFCENADKVLSKTEGVIKTSSIWDFRDLGGVEYRIFREGELAKVPQPSTSDYLRYRFTSNVDFADKSVFLVVDGRPLLINPTLHVYSKDTCVFEVHKNSLVEWLLEYPTKFRYDYASVEALEEALSWDMFDPMKMLTSGNSGVIIVNNPTVASTKRPLGRSTVYDAYTYPVPPTGVAVMSDMTIRDYDMEGYDGDQASIRIINGKPRYLMDRFVAGIPGARASKTEYLQPTTEPMSGHMVDLFSIT